MINKNFNSISQFSVPQEWIDGALSVPQAEKRKKPVVFVKFSRTFAAVASLVIVCSISLLLFFLTEENAVPPIREPESTFEVTDTTDDNQSENSTDPGVIIKPTLENGETLPNGDNNIRPSQDPSSVKPTKPSISPPEKPSEGPPLPTEPTEQPPTIAPDVPTEVPTDAPTEKPTSRPTSAPTEEPTDAPTDAPWDPQPPWVEPTAAPTESPTEPSIDYDNIGIHRRVDTSKLTGSGKVYCKLYSPSGSLIGDSNLFASSHLAIKGITDPSVTLVYYYPYRHMDITTSGSYTFVFYNESGEELGRGSIYLSANVY